MILTIVQSIVTSMTADDIKYYLLVTANPLLDSVGAISIFKLIKRLDRFSREIKIFLPGFHITEKAEPDSVEEINQNLDNIAKYNRKEDNLDYHGNEPVYHTYIPSHGDVYYNDVDFSDFMMDLEEKCPNFEYCARTDLVVLPTCKGVIVYDKVVSFNLDLMGDSEKSNETQVEKFFLAIFRLIRKDEDKNSITLISKIRDLYFDFAPNSIFDETTNVLIRLDNSLLEYMNWKAHDEIYFISYSSIDGPQAEKLKNLLEERGKNVWMAPEGIPTGLDYACVIPAALRITSHCLALLSHNSARSKWVRREIAKAISNDNKLDGILLEGFTKDDLKKYDHLDFLFENIQVRYCLTDILKTPDILTI